MSRPIYETQQDRDNERAVAEAIGQRYGCDMHKLPMKYILDFAATRDGRVVAFIEVRCRNIASTQYDEFMVSVGKLLAAKSLTSCTGIPCRLAVRWADGVTRITNLPPENYDVRIGGSTRRNDWQDIEPMAYIKIADMEDITQ